MKKGKTSRLIGYSNAKVIYGTIDSVELKSVYINIKSWVKPKIEGDNWKRVVLNFDRSLKHLILECLNKKMFNEKFVLDLDLRNSGISYNKKSFMNLEITLFMLDAKVDFKSKKLKSSLKEITDTIYLFEFLNNKYFEFHLTKCDKETIEVEQNKNL
jgi:hypothetical protein